VKFKDRTLNQLADMICGNFDPAQSFFEYRSSHYISRFFADADTDYQHDGSTRGKWVAETLGKILNEPQTNANLPPDSFCRVIQELMDQGNCLNEGAERQGALVLLNASLSREGFEAFYSEDKKCYLKHIGTNAVALVTPNPHRPFSVAEVKKRQQLTEYLDKCSEDDFINDILLPLFRQLGFHRVTAAGHKDKALEYGKDIWMKFGLPTQHMLYFGLQVKKGKLDSAGVSKTAAANIAEIHNQALMMLGNEVFDPEIGKKVLVDHAFIVSAGEITKAARNWLGGQLDILKRSQIMFLDRDDILNLYVVTNLPLPDAALLKLNPDEDELPF